MTLTRPATGVFLVFVAIVAAFGALASSSKAQTVTGGARFSQIDAAFYNRPGPYPPYRTPPATEYNLKWGRLTGRLFASTSFEYNDNIFLHEADRRSDFAITPNLTLGFLLPLSSSQIMQFDLGVGYSWYVNNPKLGGLLLAPNSHWQYRFSIEKVQIVVHDDIGSQTDPTDLGSLDSTHTNTSSGLLNFRRLYNTAGLTASWRPTRDLNVSGGYDFTLNRSLNSDFKNIDSNTHVFNLGMDYSVAPRWTIGLNANYSITEFLEQIQNSGTSYTVGPTATYRPSESLSFNGSVGYTSYTFDSTGTVADRSNFDGVTFQFGARHTINRTMNHDLRVGRTVTPGYGSNFSDTYSAQYGLHARLSAAILVNTEISYERLQASDAGTGTVSSNPSLTNGETADRVLVRLGTGYQLSRTWNVGASYSFTVKDSDQLGRDYHQNRILLDVSHRF